MGVMALAVPVCFMAMLFLPLTLMGMVRAMCCGGLYWCVTVAHLEGSKRALGAGGLWWGLLVPL